MLFPTNPDHNQNKLNLFQRVMVPRPGRKFVFKVTPGASYASVGEVYTCSGYPSNDRYSPAHVVLFNAESGSSCFDNISAWVHAEWEYVE